MKKIFTLAAAILASLSLTWATDYYTPTTEEVVAVAVTGPTIATHDAIGNAENTYTAEKDKTCCDPSDVSKTLKGFALDLKDGNVKKTLVLNIAGCDSICLYCDRNDRGIKAVFTPSKGDPETIYGQIGLRYTGFKLDPNKSYSITFTGYGHNSNDATILEGQDVRVAAVRLIPGETCTDPEAHLAFTKSTAYVGEQFSYDYGSKSGGDLSDSYTLNGVPAVKGTDYTFTSGNITVLKAGQFVMHMITAARDGYCAADLSDTILIYEATPVTEVTVDGPATAYVGEAATFTATAENASDYAWTVNGVDANTNAAEFTYTPAAAGEYSIVCSARNQFNAAEVWIASDAKVLTASNVSGELLKVTVTGGKTATVTGIFGGTADINVGTGDKSESDFEDQHGYKLNSNGYYAGVHSLEHALAEGDTAIVYITTASANLQLFSDKGTTKIGELIGGVQQGANKVILNSNAAGAKAIYLYRADIEGGGSSMNPYVAYISVVRPKTVKETSEALKGIVVEGNAIAAEDVDLIKSKENHTLGYKTAFVTAPEVVFTKTVTTTYEDDSQAAKDVEVAATVVADGEYWKATAEINSITYTLIYDKATSFSVVYMFGEKKLGEELVAANGNPAEYETYQAIKLAAFKGWYSDKALETPVADMSAEVISADKIYYAKFEYKYSQSVNISKWILENGAGKGATDKSTALINLLGSNYYTSNFAWENGNLELDSLNDEKTDRNEPYLGLKVKKTGAMFRLRLAPSSYVNIKIGAYKGKLQVAINDGEFADAVLTDGVYHYEATGEDLVSFKMKDANAVVLQQLMINESVQEVLLPWTITCSDTENGSLAADKKVAYKGEEVKLTVTPNAGYQVASVTVNGEPLAADGEGNYVFEMLDEKVTVAAIFSISTALGNTEAEAKAMKVVRDGQLLILKNGVLYNAQGAIVK